MSGYCPDCGNTLCICKEVAAQVDQTPEAAEAFVANYITMNGRPPHRPDVLKYCFEQGVAFAEGRAKAEIKQMSALSDMYESFLEAQKERDQAMAENVRLKETISYLPKVPTEPYEKAMAKEIVRLREFIASYCVCDCVSGICDVCKALESE